MPALELIEKAQARLHAQAGDWEAFSKSAADVSRKSMAAGSGRVGGADWMAEIWFEFALSKNHVLLAEYSHWISAHWDKASYRLPVLSTLVDAASKDPRLQWILEREDLHDIWVAATEVPIPNKDWRARHHVFGEFLDAYTQWMRAQPESIQERQKTYLATYGNKALQTKSLLYYAICAYDTPTKEQVRAAALANNPTYDMARLEEHYPGITGLRAAYEGMGMKSHALRDAMGKFMDGTQPRAEEAVPENGFDAH